jgi:hypothetical protein
MGETGGSERASLRDAAKILDISEGAVRKRIRRGTLRSEIGDDGRRYVFVERGPKGETRGTVEGEPEGGDALISEMRGRIDDLRNQLESEREANRENRRIIAALTSRIPELEPVPPSEAPRMPQEEPEPPSEGDDSEAGEDPGEQQRGAYRPWWRRIFD